MAGLDKAPASGESTVDPLQLLAPELRPGVHTGEAVVVPDDLIGHDVHVAARVAAAAKGGQVPASFKGVDHPVGVCDVRRRA